MTATASKKFAGTASSPVLPYPGAGDSQTGCCTRGPNQTILVDN